MIELIYNEEKTYTTDEKPLAAPRNVKQIGEPREYKKIFIEDYVHTFLMQYCVEDKDATRIAILLGTAERSGGIRHLYIKSALPIKEVGEKNGKYIFSEKVWGEIYLQCEKYFPEQEIIGWFLAKPGTAVEKTEMIEETHRIYFSGADKVLFMLEPLEGERSFFAFDGNRFMKQPGFYIYYEKNEPMHEFLLKKNAMQADVRKKEKADVAVANFRKILKDKQAKKEKQKKLAISYGMKVAITMVLFVCVATLRNQAEQIRRMERQTNQVSEQEPLVEATSDNVIIENLSGDVEEEQMSLPVQEVAVEEDIIEEIPETQSEEVLVEEIAVKDVEPQSYMVQAGDTLAKISRDNYGNDNMVDEICALNGLNDGDYIQVGETILLP